MERKPCVCCKDGKPGYEGKNAGYGYNRLEGEARVWAENNGMVKSEYCAKVVGGKKFGGPDWAKNKCGNGVFGFSTRRRKLSEVRMEKGLDEQLKSKRSTLVNKRSARAVVSRRARRIDGSKVGLVTSSQIAKAMLDPKVVGARNKLIKIKNKSRSLLSRKDRVGRIYDISRLREMAA